MKTIKAMQKQGFLIVLCLLTFLVATAQKKTKFVRQTVIDRISAVVVDGVLAEWPEIGSYDYPNQGFQYHLAQDGQAIYVAVRIKEQDRQIAALGQGFSVSFNSENKKKAKSTVTFPLADRNSFREMMADEDNKPENMRIAALNAVRGIHIRGFEYLTDGLISMQNDFEIGAAAAFDEEDALCIEYRIPLEKIGVLSGQSESHKYIAVNLKLEDRGAFGPQTPQPPIQQQQAYSGMYGYGRPVTQSRRQEPGLWLELQISDK